MSQQAAHDFTGIENGGFDVVLLSSVVQYFPSYEYLLAVIEGSLQALGDRGTIVLADIRNHALFRPWRTAVELHQASDTLPLAVLRAEIEQGMALEDELLLAPEFFGALPQYFPQIDRVEVRLQRGDATNELNQFRYQVLLHVGEAALAPTPVPTIDWLPGGDIDLREIACVLQASNADSIGWQNLLNARLQAILAAETQLFAPASNWEGQTVGHLRRALQQSPPASGIDPEDLHRLGARLGYDVCLSWSGRDRLAAAFVRPGLGAPALTFASLPSLQAAANIPWQGGSTPEAELVRTLQADLRARLPAYMVPGSIAVLDALPLTPNGKCDRRALPAPTIASKLTGDDEPHSQQERDIAAIFAELLGLERVGRHDNFFDLGGHSLLAARLAGQLQSTFGTAVPLQKIFEFPTPCKLAAWHEGEPASGAPAALPACLLPLELSGSGTPLFLLPPGGGSSLCYLNLACALDRPVYGFQLPGLLAGETRSTTVEATAATFLVALKSVRPQGPYCLAGWSYGGILALELACQLERAGEDATFLGIVDRPIVPQGAGLTRLKFGLNAVAQIASSLRRLIFSYEGLRQLAQGTGISLPPTLSDIWQRSPQEQFRFWRTLAGEAYRSLRVFAGSTIASERYQPGSYSGRAALFSARETESAMAGLLGTQSEGWLAIARGGATTYDLPGNHMSIVLDPEGAKNLAREIERAIAAAEAERQR